MRHIQIQTLIFTIVSLTGVASGQQGAVSGADDGPIVVGTPRESWKTVEIMKLESAVEFRWQTQRDSRRTNGQPKQNNRETRYRELFDISTEIAVGHRNLLDITAALQIGREDIYTHNETDQFFGHEKDFVNLYDINALILGSSALPTNVFMRRQQSLLDRAFAGSINQTTTEHGVGARFQYGGINASAQYLHRDDQLKGDFGRIDTKVKQDTLTLQSGITLTPSQKLDVAYTFDSISESQAGGLSDSYNRHDANIIHTYSFGGEAKPHELRSAVRLYNQSGRQTQDHLRWDETLTLRHTDRFETRYNLAVDSLNVRGEEQRLTRADASAKYKLFESLTSTGTVGGQRLDARGSTSDNLFVNGQLDYTKEVPLGRLDAAVGASFDAQSNSERGETLRVNNEPHTFIDGFPIILSRRNIIDGSIVITPVSGFPNYQDGVDYTVTVFADHAEIRGVVGGGFVNGQTVLVSFDVGPEAESNIDTNTTSISVRYTLTEGRLKGMAFYSTYRTVGHSVRTKNPDLFSLDDVNDLLLGVEYRFLEYNLKYEYNNHDSRFDPYTVHRWQGLYVMPLGPGSSINAELSREMIDFSKQNNQVTFDRASLRWNKRLNSSFDFNARLEYRNEESTLNGHSQGFDQIVGLAWRKRQTSIYGSFRNSFLNGPGSRQTSQTVQLNIRRAF